MLLGVTDSAKRAVFDFRFFVHGDVFGELGV